MPADQSIVLRLTIEEPVPGVVYSLQDSKNAPVGVVAATARPLSFDVPVRVAPGPRFLGEFIRREGPRRRFVYIAIGGQAGDHASLWSRRIKVDVHDLLLQLLERALAGEIVEARLPGRASDGGPSCASLKPIGGWQVAPRI